MRFRDLLQGTIAGAVLALLLSASFFRVDEGASVEVVGQNVSEFFFPRACAGAMDTAQLLDSGGSYFCAQNYTTASSGTNYALSGTYAATTGAMTFAVPASSTKVLLPDHIRITLSGTAPFNTTSIQALFAVDTARSATANYAIRTPIAVNGLQVNSSGVPLVASVASVLSHNNGAMTIATSTAAQRTIFDGSLELGLAITGDEYVLAFGGAVPPGFGPLTAARATNAARFSTTAPPVVIAPGQVGVLHLWLPGAGTNVPVFTVRACWLER